MFRSATPPITMTGSSEIPTEVIAVCRDPNARHAHIEFTVPKMTGSGTFGFVYVARMGLSGEPIAIKRVKKEEHFKTRELEILRQLNHPNIIYLKYYFRTVNELGEEYMHFVTEYMPKTLYQLICGYRRTFRNIPPFYCKLYAFQLCRALNYLHQKDICHRDVKTQNILVDPSTHTVKLCDFGSAKRLHLNEPNISYICSRYYRAPELLLNFAHYTTAIDIWSAGICIIELLTGETPFNGSCETSQLNAITQVLGSPPFRVVNSNSQREEVRFPQRASMKLKDVLPSYVPSNAIKMLKTILVYDWTQRPTALELCANEFFDELRTDKSRRDALPPIFNNWSDSDFDLRPELKAKVKISHFFKTFLTNLNSSSKEDYSP